MKQNKFSGMTQEELWKAMGKADEEELRQIYKELRKYNKEIRVPWELEYLIALILAILSIPLVIYLALK